MTANKELINEWLIKGEGDYEAALCLFKSKKKKRTFYIVAFHCQQAIEKYLKALLLGHKITFPKTHDLVKLLGLLANKDTFLVGIKKDLSALNPYAIDFRYPGEDIDYSELKIIVSITKKLRKIFLSRLEEFVRIK